MIKIKRMYLNESTIGYLTCNDLHLFTLELPDLGNEPNISCIPEGEYEYYIRHSSKNGFVIELKNVPNRSFIQIHSGNFTSQIEGCILVGESIKDINNDSVPDVTNSKKSLKKLLEAAPDTGIVKIYN